MKPVSEIQQVVPGLFVWQGFEPEIKAEMGSTALLTGEGFVIIDPVPLVAAARRELLGPHPVAAVVLTNANHERAAADWPDVPLAAHAVCAGEFAVPVHRPLSDGNVVFGNGRVIELAGASPGEIALHFPEIAGGVLVVGDALINPEPAGLQFLPDKYCTDAKQLRRSARALEGIEPAIVTFAHGLPLVSRAAARLRELVQ